MRKKTGKKYTNPEYRKKYYAEHAEEAKKKTIDWRNNNLEYSKKRDREYQLNNIDKISKRQKEWRESNKEHMKEYRIKNREPRKISQWNRRAKQTNSGGDGITLEQWEQLKADYCYLCAYCGKKKKLTLDHIIPIYKGGKHEIENSVPACNSCNTSKGAKSLIMFIYYRFFIR